MIKFRNIHGEFELEIGGKYDLTCLDVYSGDVFPIFSGEIVGETKEAVLIRVLDSVDEIKKDIIVHEDII